MGYSSQVVFAARGAKVHVIAALTTWRLESKHPEALGSVLEDLCLAEDEDDYLLTFQANCKWYLAYPDVQMFEALFDLLRNDEEFIDTAFIRVGEDANDTETRYSGAEPYDLCSLQCSACLDVDPGKPIREVLGAI